MASKFHNYGPIGAHIADGEYAQAAVKLIEPLIESGGNQVKAAAIVKVTDRTMRRWIQVLRDQGHDVVVLAREKIEQREVKTAADKKKPKRRTAA